MSSTTNLVVFVYTGDRKCAGTDGSVHMRLYGDNGRSAKAMTLSTFFTNNFERDQIDTFRVSPDNLDRFGKIEHLELWKDKILGIISDHWFVDKIVVENCATNTSFIFPVFRWIKAGNRYHFKQYDTSLPQFDGFLDQRKRELEEQKESYRFDQKIPNGPVQIKEIPPDEQFSFDHKWDIMKTKLQLSAVSKINKITHGKWKCIEDLAGLYSETFPKSRCADVWNSDLEFGRKRVASINPTVIRLFTEIPKKFPVTDGLLEPLLEGMTIQEAISQKKLFYCDLEILEGIHTKPGYILCHPIALLFVDKERQLRPIAIQLFQKPGPQNPIFTPLDEANTWTFVKMWYNNADASLHQPVTHLGYTHLLMEGVTIAAHRNLSPSHPVFKILAPHFLYIIAINSKALGFLVAEGGWVDKTMAIASKGMLALTVKGFGIWRMDVEGLLPEDLKARGVDDLSVLPGYYYRDDALLVFDAIRKYVVSYLGLYYKSQAMVEEDTEIQAWAQELVKERNKSEGGVGLKGVPGNGTVSSLDELVRIVISIIFTCSVSHASANFGQYEEYSFQPNYPSSLKGKPPTSKNAKVTDEEILESLPNVVVTQDILTVTKILSRKGTNSLGDFERQYIFDPKAIKVVDEFRGDLEEVTKKIKARNEQRSIPYEHLLPESIPNSISI